jgi:hypothetical protein
MPPAAPLILNRVGERDTLMGLVWDGSTGVPIDGATIGVPGTSSYTLADDRGRFRLPLRSGRHVLVTRRNGFLERRDTITVVAGQGVSLGLRLWRLPSTLVELCDCSPPGGRLVLELTSADSNRVIHDAIVVIRGPNRETRVDTIRATDFRTQFVRRDYLPGREGLVSIQISARGFQRWRARDVKLPSHLLVLMVPDK